MKHSVTLGLRLALGSTGEARYRSLAMSGAALIGTILLLLLLLLVVAAFARAVLATRDSHQPRATRPARDARCVSRRRHARGGQARPARPVAT